LIGIVAPKSTDVAVVRQTVGRLGINHYRIEANTNPSRFSTTIAPKFFIRAHGAITGLVRSVSLNAEMQHTITNRLEYVQFL
jgi:hypothetical protein